MGDLTEINEEDEWQTSCKVMKERGAHLLQTRQWTDCTLLIGPESQPFQAHKLILSMASPVFESMLLNGEEGGQVVTIPETDPEVFKNVLNYIYTEDININSFELARDVYRSADKFMLHQLAHVCLTYMSCNITYESACEAYELGLLFKEKMLIDESLMVIKSNPKQVLSSKSFEQAHIDTVIHIFSIEGLKIDSELDLFHAAERYARARKEGLKQNIVDTQRGKERLLDINVERMRLDGNDENDNVIQMNNNREDVSSKPESGETQSINPARALLKHIRFLTLTAAQFAQIARSELLVESEAFALLVNILYPATDVPLPSGFCTSKEPRYRHANPRQNIRASLNIRLSFPASASQTQQSVPSPKHLLFGQPCLLIMVPRFEYCTNTNSSVYIGFYFRVDIPAESKCSYVATLEFRLIGAPPGQDLVCTVKDKKFDCMNTEIGCPRFIALSEALRPDRGLLTHGAGAGAGALTLQLRVDAEDISGAAAAAAAAGT